LNRGRPTARPARTAVALVATLLSVAAFTLVGCTERSTTSTATSSTTTTLPALQGAFAGPTTGRVLDAAQPLRVTLFGDSLAYDAAPAIRANLTSTGVVAVAEWHIAGYGFGPGPGYLPEGFDWKEMLVRGTAETRPEVVVTSFGLVDTLNIMQGRYTPEAFDVSLREALDLLTVGDTKVLLLGIPPTVADAGRPTQTIVEGPLNSIMRAVVADYPGEVEYLDLDRVLSDSGRPVYEFAGRRVRKLDLTHFCPDGAALLAVAIHDTLARSWSIPASAAGWSLGDWRADARYDDPSCTVGRTWPDIGV
jgi:hypothetical protein